MEPSPFLTHIEETMYQRRYAKRTIETYVLWIRRFIVYHNKRHPSTMGNQEVEQFLSHLVLKRHVAPQTQALVLNALNYLYKDILKAPLSLRLNFVKSLQPRKLPVVLTQDEMVRLIKVLPTQYFLPAALLYGSGLRLMEAVRLRVKDIDFDFKCIRVWNGKGGKHRTVTMAAELPLTETPTTTLDQSEPTLYFYSVQKTGGPMPTPRKQLISLDATPYYHCTSRCVRRAFLCGVDPHTQQSYEHRRQWVEDRTLKLAEVFAIDVCAYAVMSNHLHVVLHIDVSTAMHWSDQELCERWHRLYKGTALSQRFVRGEALDSAEMQTLQVELNVWRYRLRDISWFMRTLNEPIARMANAEDQCKGSFWESRFRSQALLDEKALAACMAYVDLNPIRAKMADSPETSEHTSIKRRIAQLKETQEQPQNLAHFVGNPREPMPQGLPFHLKDYVELVEWSCRILREDKRGHISNQLPPILMRLGIPGETWLQLTKTFESQFSHFVGDPVRLKAATTKLGFQRSPGLSHCKAAFS